MGRYIEPKSGEWVRPRQRGYLMACCDCGLVHTMNFRIKKGKVQYQPFRNNRSTAQIRRYMREQTNGS